jgi:hypothetical protein
VRALILLCLFSPSLFGNENYQINESYHAGSNLIFDCKNLYLACVSEVSREQCQLDRQFAIDKKQDHYPCAMLKQFDTKEHCLKKNYELINAITIKKFCYLDRLHH